MTDTAVRTYAGPKGMRRSIPGCFGLMILTLGIYGIYWTYVTYREMYDYNETGLRSPLAQIVALLAGPASFFLIPAYVRELARKHDLPCRVSTYTGLWAWAPFFVLRVVLPGWLVVLLILPLVGSAVWFVLMQRQLNTLWETLP